MARRSGRQGYRIEQAERYAGDEPDDDEDGPEPDEDGPDQPPRARRRGQVAAPRDPDEPEFTDPFQRMEAYYRHATGGAAADEVAMRNPFKRQDRAYEHVGKAWRKRGEQRDVFESLTGRRTEPTVEVKLPRQRREAEAAAAPKSPELSQRIPPVPASTPGPAAGQFGIGELLSLASDQAAPAAPPSNAPPPAASPPAALPAAVPPQARSSSILAVSAPTGNRPPPAVIQAPPRPPPRPAPAAASRPRAEPPPPASAPSSDELAAAVERTEPDRVRPPGLEAYGQILDPAPVEAPFSQGADFAAAAGESSYHPEGIHVEPTQPRVRPQHFDDVVTEVVRQRKQR